MHIIEAKQTRTIKIRMINLLTTKAILKAYGYVAIYTQKNTRTSGYTKQNNKQNNNKHRTIIINTEQE